MALHDGLHFIHLNLITFPNMMTSIFIYELHISKLDTHDVWIFHFYFFLFLILDFLVSYIVVYFRFFHLFFSFFILLNNFSLSQATLWILLWLRPFMLIYEKKRQVCLTSNFSSQKKKGGFKASTAMPGANDDLKF